MKLIFQGKYNWENNDPVSYQQWKSSYMDIDSKMPVCFSHRLLTQYKDLCWNFEMIKYQAINEEDRNRLSCTAVLLQNLAEPQWISVPCNKKLSGNIFCSRLSNSIQYWNFINGTINHFCLCEKQQIKRNQTCLQFDWYTFIKKANNITQSRWPIKDKSTSYKIYVRFILDTIKNNIVLPVFSSQFTKIIFIKKLSYVYNETVQPLKETTKAFLLHTKNVKHFYIPGYMFQCEKEIYKIHTDLFQILNNCSQYDKLQLVLYNRMQMCPVLLYLTNEGKCKFYISLKEKIQIKENKFMNSNCTDVELITQSYVRNITCKKNGNDVQSCLEKGLLSCTKTHLDCFNFSDICHYKLDHQSNLVPCSSGAHLYNCQKFECNMKFKCLALYCISWSYVCDGKWDCPNGIDESDLQGCGQFRTCEKMLKCQGSQICIHLDDICDGVSDCPNGNDEGNHCDWKISKCIKSCKCLISAVHCSNVSAHDTDQLYFQNFSFFAIFIHNSVISDTFLKGNSLDIHTDIHVISIKNSKIIEPCCLLVRMIKLINVDLGFNYIQQLKEKCFSKFLKLLSLNDNLITHILDKAFARSGSLVFLNLSNNFLQSLSETGHFHYAPFSCFINNK